MKMVCTSLRPMRPASPLVGDLEGICSFVADWMTYEPPETPQQPSPTIVAPDTALKAQVGGVPGLPCAGPEPGERLHDSQTAGPPV